MLRTSLIFIAGLVLTGAPILLSGSVPSVKEVSAGTVAAAICLGAGSLVVVLTMASIVTRRKKLTVVTGIAAALTIVVCLLIARLIGGHTLSTELGLAAGAIGLIAPALLAAFHLGEAL